MLSFTVLVEPLVLGTRGFRPDGIFETAVVAAIDATKKQVQSDSKAFALLPPHDTLTSSKPTVFEWTARNLPGTEHVPKQYQHTLSLAAGKARLNVLITSGDTVDRSRLNSCSAPLASAWITSIPKNKGTTLANKPYANAARHRLGLPFANAPHATACVCTNKNAAIDIHHELSCVKVRKLEVNLRHDMLNSIGHKFFRRLGLPAMPELQNTATQQRTDTHVIDENGESFFLDWSIVQPTCPSHLAAGSKRQLAVANAAAAQKHKENDKWAQEHDATAIALVAETTGAWTQEAHDFFKHITRTEDASCSMSRKELLASFVSTLAVAIQQGNHRIVSRVACTA